MGDGIPGSWRAEGGGRREEGGGGPMAYLEPGGRPTTSGAMAAGGLECAMAAGGLERVMASVWVR
jgi:hypothetical protein